MAEGSGTILSTEMDFQIERSLDRAVHAFAIRWLPLRLGHTRSEAAFLSKAAKTWRRVRRDMLRVMNRPSYRSMLTLFLFGLTPVPTAICENEEGDGLSGSTCVQAALQQVQLLRAQQKVLRFNGSKVSPTLSSLSFGSDRDAILTECFINAENTAYWAALTFDTSASITQSLKASLSPGLFGVEADASWHLVRSCTRIFHAKAEAWLSDDLEMNDERANVVIAAASAWKLLAWKVAAVFKEALSDGHEEREVLRANRAFVDAVEEFDCIYRPLLIACQTRVYFLENVTRLRWCELGSGTSKPYVAANTL